MLLKYRGAMKSHCFLVSRDLDDAVEDSLMSVYESCVYAKGML